MRTINISEEGYQLVLEKKRRMEEEKKRVVSIARVLDELLKELKELKQEKRYEALFISD
jgi:DNA topoisomerase VI subunit B